MINDLVRFRTWTENPRVGGSIPPLRVREDVFVTEFDRLISLVVRCREWNQATDTAVPGM
jgi:hypothetical protein